MKYQEICDIIRTIIAGDVVAQRTTKETLDGCIKALGQTTAANAFATLINMYEGSGYITSAVAGWAKEQNGALTKDAAALTPYKDMLCVAHPAKFNSIGELFINMEQPGKQYDVTVTRCGGVRVVASSAEEATNIANELGSGVINWDDDWEVTDVVEVDE